MFRTVAASFRAVLLGTACAAFVLGGAGCSSPVSPASFGKFSQVDLVEGTGDPINDGLVLKVHYTGWLYDPSQPESKGKVFDSSAGQNPFEFTLGAAQVIDGWEQGLRGMKVGGLRRLVIPPSMAYEGSRRNGIPAYSTLVFEIELVSATNPVIATTGL